MSDPCDESNWDIDNKNHSPLRGFFSSREELYEWRSECLFKNLSSIVLLQKFFADNFFKQS
jgi:hypothetical protein